MEVDNSTSFDEAFADDERTDIITTPVKASSVPKDLPLVTYDTPPNSRTFDLSPSDTNSDKKKRIRRNKKGGKHHRKWRPYNKLSWDERKVLEEKESKKAALKREEQFASGQPMAPYNTTQFIMDLHDPDPKYGSTPTDISVAQRLEHPRPSHQSSVSGNHDGSGSVESSDEYYSSPDDEEIFLEKEFSVDYENYHAEHIRSLTKEELVKEYLELEMKLEKLQKQVQDHDSSSSEKDKVVTLTMDTSDKPQTEDLLSKLRSENEQLRKENEQLRKATDETAENKENNPET